MKPEARIQLTPARGWKPDPSWRERGSCRDQLDLVDNAYQSTRGQKEMATRLCNSCPVMWECRAYVLLLDPEGPFYFHSTWGGIVAADRKRWRAENKEQRPLLRETYLRMLYPKTVPMALAADNSGAAA